MDLSHRNYFRGVSDKQWRVEIDRCQRPPLSFFEEARNNAEMIWEHSNGHIYVLFSGGMDSMYVVSMLRHLKMKFTPVVIRFSEDNNFEDVDWSLQFCQGLNIKPLILDLDYRSFIESGRMYDYAVQTECSGYRMSHIFWAVEQLSGSVVMGECPPNILFRPNSRHFIFEVPRYDFSPALFWKANGIGGTPFFLTYTSESLFAFMVDQTLDRFFDRRVIDLTIDNLKVDVYNNQSHFKIPFRLKQDGLEFFEKTPLHSHSEIARTNSLCDLWGERYVKPYHQAVDDLKFLG